MMARRHHIGSIRGSSTANQSASRIVHPDLGVWTSCDVNDGSWSKTTAGASEASNDGTTTDGMGFTLDETKDTSSTGQWRANTNAATRYYREVIGPKGPLTWADQFQFEALIMKTSGDSGQEDGIAFGLAEEAVATSHGSSNGGTAFAHIGFGCHNRDSTGVLSALIQGTAQTTAGNSSGAGCYGVYSIPIDNTDADGNPHVRRAFINLLDSNRRVLTATGMADYTEEFTSTEKVTMFLAPSFSGTSSETSNTGTCRFKVWYRITLLDLNPDYIPGAAGQWFGGMSLP